MSAAPGIMADPVSALVAMALEEAARVEKKYGDRQFLQRVAGALHERANACGCKENTCGGCRVVLAIASELERHEAAP